jgi:hypothetical protein
MSRISEKEKKIVVEWLRNSRALVKNKDSFATADEVGLAELEACLECLLKSKAENQRRYDALYSESRFKEKARYHYKKTCACRDKNAPDTKDVSFEENQHYKGIAEENARIKSLAFGGLVSFEWIDGNLPRNEYEPYEVNGRAFSFTPDKKHLDMLAELNTISESSKELVALISSVKKLIKFKKDKIASCANMLNPYNTITLTKRGADGKGNKENPLQEA